MITKTSTTATQPNPEQLTLLPNDSVTARFRLSRETRERGLRHVAEIRRMLAERSGALDASASQSDRAA
jgi:RecA/RadA recombinase